MSMISATFERHGLTYVALGTVGSPSMITMKHNGEPVPLSGPIYFAAADALAEADRAQWPNGQPQPAPAPQPAPIHTDKETIAQAMEKVQKLLRMTTANGASPAVEKLKVLAWPRVRVNGCLSSFGNDGRLTWPIRISPPTAS